MTAALSIQELQAFHKQYPARGRRRTRKDGIFDDSEFVAELDEYAESYELRWAAGWLRLKERGLPTKGVDIDEYIHSGTPDLSDCETESESDSQMDSEGDSEEK